MLAFDWHTVRMFLHLLGATIWVGGQLVLGALVPALRGVDDRAPRAVARAFARIAWPAYALLVLTGIWNIVALGDVSSDYRATLTVKLVFVGLSGVGAFLHQRARSRGMIAAGGALAALGGLAALLFGVQLG